MGSRCTGSPHGSLLLALVDTQMSFSPKVPGRFEAMKNIFPSAEMNGQPSLLGVLKFTWAPAPKSSMLSAGLHSP